MVKALVDRVDWARVRPRLKHMTVEWRKTARKMERREEGSWRRWTTPGTSPAGGRWPVLRTPRGRRGPAAV